MKLVIIGGVAGGASAAARARRLSESAEIIVFERGPDVSFANCGLPYHIGGEIENRDKLLVTKPQTLKDRYRLDIRAGVEVVKIDRQAKRITARRLADGELSEESYDALILAPGAAPLRPPIPGIDLSGVFTLRDLGDMDRIKEVVDRGVDHAVIVGAGFIGVELAENFLRRGLRTTIVELQDQVLPVLDPEMATPIAQALRDRGADLVLGDSAEAFREVDGGLAIDLKSERSLTAQLVVLGIGVRPENALATAAGLEVGPRGGIRVDDRMRTSDPSIYAVGDAVETFDFPDRRPTQVPLAGPANRQGRIAADNIFGRDSRFRGTQATAIVGFFEHTAATTGRTERMLRRDGTEFFKVYVHANHHAGYYPGATPMTIKLLADSTSHKVLGAQIVGEAGVDNRINVLAMAIQAGMTVQDLEEAELAYAPQFGSAKDPINMAGFVASNIAAGDYRQIHVEDWDGGLSSSAFLLDVRTPGEFAAGTIPGAVSIPIEELRERLDEVPRDRPVVAFCRVGMRGYMATLILQHAGVDASNLGGGYVRYLLSHPKS